MKGTKAKQLIKQIRLHRKQNPLERDLYIVVQDSDEHGIFHAYPMQSDLSIQTLTDLMLPWQLVGLYSSSVQEKDLQADIDYIKEL